MRNRQWKSMRPSNVSEAMELCIEFAAEKKRRPVKVLADLMGVELKTLYRWLAETSMPLNRIRQFEDFCGVSYVSEYLCMARGDKVVVEIPTGKKAAVTDLAEIQASFAETVGRLARFYQSGIALDETVAGLTTTLSHLAYQRSNVLANPTPEFDFGADK